MGKVGLPLWFSGKDVPFLCRGHEFEPWLGNQIPPARQHGQKKKKIFFFFFQIRIGKTNHKTVFVCL